MVFNFIFTCRNVFLYYHYHYSAKRDFWVLQNYRKKRKGFHLIIRLTIKSKKQNGKRNEAEKQVKEAGV